MKSGLVVFIGDVARIDFLIANTDFPKVTDEGIKAFSDGVRTNSTLTKVELDSKYECFSYGLGLGFWVEVDKWALVPGSGQVWWYVLSAGADCADWRHTIIVTNITDVGFKAFGAALGSSPTMKTAKLYGKYENLFLSYTDMSNSVY